MSAETLPQDIWLLIAKELGERREFNTLFCCSVVSRKVSSLAVEQLYSILQVSDPFIEGKLQSAQLWRSLILSSIGSTVYPYCAYVLEDNHWNVVLASTIQALSLGSGLGYFLDDIRSDTRTRNFFFESPMQQFQDDMNMNTRNRFVREDLMKINIKCADSITKYIKELAVNSGTAVALRHLEVGQITRDTLVSWITRLGTLTFLQLENGSVLNSEVATALSKYCPNFKELECFQWAVSTTSEEVAAFFQTLRQNSLQRLAILSTNLIEEPSLDALKSQAESLRELCLKSLSSSATKSLGKLSKCTALEIIDIEMVHWEPPIHDSQDEDSLRTAAWIRSCKQLHELNLCHIGNALSMLKNVLEDPEIRLKQLKLQDYWYQISDLSSRRVLHDSADGTIESEVWTALRQQEALESLTIASQDGAIDGLILSQHPELTESICRLSKLTTLNLMQTYVSSAEIRRFTSSLPLLEDLSFGGDIIDDSVIEHLRKLPRLVSLSINAVTAFSFESLQSFTQNLNPGMRLDLLNQWYDARLTDDQLAWLELAFTAVDGRIVITYTDNPDDLHEADFSEDD
ncbi:hypothetical protein F5Y18DRAFT_441196 [Xylariaceae sp. FL1019]|nr:hypothetical protein F5Y18DRAFT_441196 [Xylariaceae sp. FL1019]